MSAKKSPKKPTITKKRLSQEVTPASDKPKNLGGRPRTNTIDVLDIEVKPPTDKRCQTGGHDKPGRPPGHGNLNLSLYRDALQESFERLGGVEFLLELARKDLKGYCILLKTLAPTSISTVGANGEPGPLEIKIVLDKPLQNVKVEPTHPEQTVKE